MSFNARITFTGICTFVPNQDRSRFYVLLPNAQEGLGTGESIDRTVWRRHRGFVRFNLKDLAYAHGITVEDGLIGIRYFKRSEDEGGVNGETGTEVHIQSPGAPGSLTVEPNIPFADLSRFAPDYSTIDSDLITTKGMQIPPSACMRMLIERGTLKAGRVVDGWRIPNTLNSQDKINSPSLAPQALAHEIVLELNGLTSFKLFASSIPGGSGQSLDFAAPDDQTVDVVIANFCDDNPLQWPKQVDSQPDADFKWHYSLLDEDTQDELTSLLSGLELPVPLPVQQVNGSGADCYLSLAYTDVDF